MFDSIQPKPLVGVYQQYCRKQYPSLTQARPVNSHKNLFGTLGIIGATEGMAGAVLLAGTAALYSGCGTVMIGFNQATLPLHVFSTQPELMLHTAAQLVKRNNINTWLIGSGLGRNEGAARALHALWNNTQTPLILDSDALHLLVAHPKLFPTNKRTELVLTPHAGEAALLLNTTINQVQNHRVWTAREIANRYRCWVVLKGHETVISSARGFLHVNHTGNAALSSSGSGHVLSGVIASLLAQGIQAEEAIPAAVWLHGVAAELCTQTSLGPIGLTASELPAVIRWLRNKMIDNK